MINVFTNLGIEAQAIEQPIDLSIPENKLMLAFYLTAPEVENDRRSLNIISGMRKAKRDGRLVGSAMLGFKNSRDEHNKAIIVPDEKALTIKEAFEMLDTGTYSIEDVRRWINKQGIKCSRNNFNRLIKNPVYCGKIYIAPWRDEPEQIITGIHTPIITEDLFYSVQNKINKKRTKPVKNTLKPELPLRGFLLCGQCGGTFQEVLHVAVGEENGTTITVLVDAKKDSGQKKQMKNLLNC